MSRPHLWRAAGQALLAKLIAEFSYEELLHPQPVASTASTANPTDATNPASPAGTANLAGVTESADLSTATPPVARVGRGEPAGYRLTCGDVSYTFTARRGTFGTWWLDAASLRRAGPSGRPDRPGWPDGRPGSRPGGRSASADDPAPTDPGGYATSRGPVPADDPVRFVLDAAGLLDWPDDVTADVVRELTATHAADVRLLAAARPAAELADATYTEIEGFATGHPCMVANKGRLGFGLTDAGRYTPEAATPLRLLWVAAHPELATFASAGFTTASFPTAGSGGAGPAGADDPDARGGVLTQRRLLAAELDPSTRAAFATTLATWLATAGSGAEAGTDRDDGRPAEPGTAPARPAPPRGEPVADPPDGRGREEQAPSQGEPAATHEEYVWLPVHPWQWEHVIAPLFAAEIATGRLVLLGKAPDRYLPLQSVRTLVNIDRPARFNVKLALMIRNTLVWRGMSADDAHAGPDTSAWLVGIRDADAFLRDVTRVLPLPEIAGATVTHSAYGELARAPYRFHELLGVLWRQPVESLLAPGERARTFASLLLVGSDGRALVGELVARSGRGAREWLRALLSCLLPPLLHYLYVYGVAFTPHGENVVLVFDGDDAPTRIAIKDFGADIELVDAAHTGDDRRGWPEQADLPASAARYLRRWPASDLAHSILSALCAGHFRFFAVILEDHLGVDEREFWTLVRAEIENYHRAFPEHADRFALFGLLAPTFDRVCLNREQLAGTGFHDRPDRDGGFDVSHGQVASPLHLVTIDTVTPKSRPPKTERARR
ncbi:MULTISPECIES: IucA/IucC family siderophore biosynthesis protein [Protofrankia]|uniref:IucA/IucC family protein n=1 Tax=Protofrankia TaxID=2994361 RepID=UPI000B2B23C3|nr:MULTISPECIES: IucA/IucC family protein [Protofrankia]